MAFENSEKNDAKKPKIGLLAAVAMLAGISSAEAGGIKTAHLEGADLAKIEALVEQNKIPIEKQIAFVEDTFGSGGAYYKELADTGLSRERFAAIYGLANSISARLTSAYDKDANDPKLKEYFSDAEMLRNATAQYYISKERRTFPCNRFSLRDKSGNVFSLTATHCISNSGYAPEHFNVADVAGKFVPKSEIDDMKIRDVQKLPTMNSHASAESIMGRVLTSFSIANDGKEQTILSFALPKPANISLMLNAKERELFNTYNLNNSLAFFRPYEKDMLHHSSAIEQYSGASGSPVAAHGLGIIGSYSATKEVACTDRCYAVSFFMGPEDITKAVQGAYSTYHKGARVAGN